jgi:protein-tyrosine-phosphatase
MEVRQLARLFDEYPSAKKKAFLLGTVRERGAGSLEIADPYGGAEEDYARCFEEVTACTRAIADTLT